jgi:hypothetical protein
VTIQIPPFLYSTLLDGFLRHEAEMLFQQSRTGAQAKAGRLVLQSGDPLGHVLRFIWSDQSEEAAAEKAAVYVVSVLELDRESGSPRLSVDNVVWSLTAALSVPPFDPRNGAELSKGPYDGGRAIDGLDIERFKERVAIRVRQVWRERGE